MVTSMINHGFVHAGARLRAVPGRLRAFASPLQARVRFPVVVRTTMLNLDVHGSIFQPCISSLAGSTTFLF